MPKRESTASANKLHREMPWPLRGPAGSGCLRQDRQWQVAHGTRFVHQLRCQVEATAAAGAGTSPHGQLGHAATPGINGLADVVIGDSVADADVHGAA